MNRWLLVLWSIVLFCGCLALNGRHQNFPWYYHPDEPGKVEQVLEKEWNLHHPPLLLEAASVAAKARGATNEQSVVESGRFVSTAFIAGAIVALSLLAYLWSGWPAAILAGLLLGTHHQLYELSHYFKEDSALLFGVALSALAIVLDGERPSLARACFVGASCAVAVSGKYLGAIMLLPALAALAAYRVPHTKRLLIGLAVFVGASFATWVALNLPVLTHMDTFHASFARETELVVKGQGGATRSVPHAEYWAIFRDNTTPATWLLLIAFIADRVRDWRTIGIAKLLIAGLPFVYTIALSFSPKTNDRYFLPAAALFTMLAAIGASDLASRWPRRWVWPAAAIIALAAQFPSWSESRPGWLAYERAFQRDDNADLITFLREHVPADAVILKDNRIALPDPERKKHAARLGVVPQHVVARRFAADIGSLEKAHAAGITHIIVSESDYGKFFRASLRPQKGEEGSFAAKGAFYRRLFSEGDELWRRERGTVIYLHPGIIVYRLP